MKIFEQTSNKLASKFKLIQLPHNNQKTYLYESSVFFKESIEFKL